jgi:hypothetical protein
VHASIWRVPDPLSASIVAVPHTFGICDHTDRDSCLVTKHLLLQAYAEREVCLSAEVEDVKASLQELHGVLVEGGLSGDMRKRGAEAVKSALALLCALSSDITDLRDRVRSSEARLTAVRVALTAPVPVAGTAGVAGGSTESGDRSPHQDDSAGSRGVAGESSEWAAPAAAV